MWQERADYGHFFFRIPSGESAADAYDRVSGFNESLWRSFGEEDFASVCVLVTHGLMTRVFLMKWYHFSVEYFEDLRNVNHCEFVVMKLNEGSGKYILQNQLRTWSELKRERANSKTAAPQSPIPIRKKWGGCQDGSGENGDDFARRQRQRRQNTVELFASGSPWEGEKRNMNEPTSLPDPGLGQIVDSDAVHVKMSSTNTRKPVLSPERLDLLRAGRDGGGSRSGAASPSRSGSEDSDTEIEERLRDLPVRRSLATALSGELDGTRSPDRVRADALGDQSDVEDDEEATELTKAEAFDKSYDGAIL